MGRSSLVALFLFLGACVTTPTGEVDLRKVQAYTVAAQDTLQGFVAIYSTSDPEFSAELQGVTDALAVVRARVQQGLDGGATTIDIVQAIDLSLIAADALAQATVEDPEKRARVVAMATALGGILRLVRIELVE